MKGSGNIVLVLALVAGLALAMSSAPAAPTKRPAEKPPVRPEGPAADVTGPEGEHVTVMIGPAQIADSFDEALEAAELAEAQHGRPPSSPAAPASGRPRPPSSPAAPAPGRPRPPSSPAAAGPDAGKAARLAPGVAANIRTKQYNYSHQALKDFQKAAGVTADGIYGPVTAKELGKYTNAPKPLFKAGASASN